MADGETTDQGRNSEGRQTFLLKLSDTLRAEPDADAIASRAVQMLLEALSLDLCVLVSLDPTEGQAHVTHQVARAGLPSFPPRLALADYPALFPQFFDRALVVDDSAVAPVFSDLEKQSLETIGLRAFVGVAFHRCESNPIWRLLAASVCPRRWAEGDVTLIEEVTERTWAAIERARADTILRQSEARYRDLFESIDTGYCVLEVIFDEHGKAIDLVVIETNPAFRKQTGLQDAVGRFARALVPTLEPFWYETYGRIVRTGQPERFDHRVDGLNRWYNVHAFRVGGSEQPRVAVLFDDIKPRKLRELNTAFLDQVGQELARVFLPDEIMQRIGARVGQFLQVSGCVFCDVDEEKEQVTVHYGWTIDQVPSLKQTFRLADYLTPEFARASRAGETFIVRDTSRDERTDAVNYACLEIGAFVVIPYFHGGRWTACFAATNIAPRDWREDEIELLKEISARLFSRIEHARAELALRASEERQAFLLALSDALRLISHAIGIQDAAARMLGRELRADRCYCCEYDEQRDVIVVNSEYLRTDSLPLLGEHPLQPFRTLIRLAQAGEPIIVDDVETHAILSTHAASYRERDVQAFIVAPLIKSGSVVAAVCVAMRHARQWSVQEARLVTEVAERTWAAVERARVEAALRDSEQRFREFADASSGALWIRDARTLAMEYVSPAIVRIYGVEAGEFLGDVRRWAAAIVPEDRDLAFKHLEQARHGEAVVHEFRIQRVSDGAFRWIRNTDFPLLGDDGRVQRIGGIAEDVTEAKLAVEHQSVLLAELQHRVRNIMAIIRSIAARTGHSASSVADYAELMAGRLLTLSRVQALLTRAANVGVSIAALVRDELAAQAQKGQYTLEGPDIVLSPKAAEVLTLAIHELTTNALKYGALSSSAGHLRVSWRTIERYGVSSLSFDWNETGAPPCPQTGPGALRRRGFGSELIEGRIPYELNGRGQMEITSGGAQCHLEFPLEEGASVLETDAPRSARVFGGALDMSGAADLSGERILVVEDDYYLATDAARAVRGAGAEAVGPFPSELTALREIRDGPVTAAILDLNLGSGPSFMLAETLTTRGVPLVFITGYDEEAIPPRWASVPRLRKPVDLRKVVDTLAAVLSHAGHG